MWVIAKRSISTLWIRMNTWSMNFKHDTFSISSGFKTDLNTSASFVLRAKQTYVKIVTRARISTLSVFSSRTTSVFGRIILYLRNISCILSLAVQGRIQWHLNRDFGSEHGTQRQQKPWWIQLERETTKEEEEFLVSQDRIIFVGMAISAAHDNFG